MPMLLWGYLGLAGAIGVENLLYVLGGLGVLYAFAAMFLGGGLGLYVALGARNPSTAIGLASFLCPFATFYAITSISLGSTLGVFLVVAAAYGFTTAAMLIPAIYEFDVATGRTTAEEES